jgi:hypothetical protein
VSTGWVGARRGQRRAGTQCWSTRQFSPALVLARLVPGVRAAEAPSKGGGDQNARQPRHEGWQCCTMAAVQYCDCPDVVSPRLSVAVDTGAARVLFVRPVVSYHLGNCSMIRILPTLTSPSGVYDRRDVVRNNPTHSAGCPPNHFPDGARAAHRVRRARVRGSLSASLDRFV